MRPPAHAPVPPLLLLLSLARGNCRCVQLLLLLLLLLSSATWAGRGRRATSVAPYLLPPWMAEQQVNNMSRKLQDAWGGCGHSQDPPKHHRLRHHGRRHHGQMPEVKVEHVCSHESEFKRRKKFQDFQLATCPQWAVNTSWENEVANSTARCFTALRHLVHIDQLAAAAVCRYSRILRQYDCHSAATFIARHLSPAQEFCTQCQEAYKYWVCSQLFPYYDNGRHIKPCRRFCHEVEQKCPYLLPKDKPVAGEPTFLCEDPAIGELENQESSYGKDSCCYKLSTHLQPMCSFNENLAEHQPPVLCSSCPTTSGTQERPSDNQCLSANGADPSQSNSSTAAPSSSGSCSVISRKHCWTRTALSILLLCLVRTRVWLPRGFT